MSESLPSSSREMRNRAEKQRRDKLNAYISELYSLVPSAAAAPRKLDKTSTLRLSANYLRIHQNVDLRLKPYNRWNAIAGHLILEKLDSFLLVVSCCSGKIIYVSDRVEKLLGHAQVDMMGYQLSGFIHQDDQTAIENRLNSFAAQVNLAESDPADFSYETNVYSFECRIAGRQLSRGEPTVYERVGVSGTFRGPRRRRDWINGTMNNGGKGDDRSLIPTAQQHSSINGFSEPLFICVVRLLQTPNTLPPLTMIQSRLDEYFTQHTLDGTIIQTDHRISTIAGYLSGEVKGVSAYKFFYDGDLEYTLKAQSMMLSNREGQVTYRLKTCTGKLIFLRSRGFIQYDDNTKEITGFFCINTQISEEEGMKEIQEIRMMLESLNVGNVSSHINAIEMNESSLNSQCTNQTSTSVLRGSSNSINGISGRTNGFTSRNSTGGLSSVNFCTSSAPELQFCPSESSISSSINEDRSLSANSHLRLTSPGDLNGISPLAFRAVTPSDIPFPWHSDLTKLNTGPSPSLMNAQETFSSVLDHSVRNSISHKNNGINRPGIASSVMHQSEVVDGKGLIIQNGFSDHSDTKLVVTSSFRVHDETTQQPPHIPIIASNSPIHYQLQQQQIETFQISTSSSDLLSQNTYLNTCQIAWSPKIKPPAKDMTQKENLGLVDQENNGDIEQNYYNDELERKITVGTTNT